MNSASTSHYLHPTSLTFNESGFYLLCQCWKGFFCVCFFLQCLALLKKTKSISLWSAIHNYSWVLFFWVCSSITEKRRIRIVLGKTSLWEFSIKPSYPKCKKKKKKLVLLFFFPMKAREIMSWHKIFGAQESLEQCVSKCYELNEFFSGIMGSDNMTWHQGNVYIYNWGLFHWFLPYTREWLL